MARAEDLKRVVDAIGFAAEHHVEPDGSIQLRKGTDIPYLSHLLAVAALVWEGGGDTDQVVAGVLHDVLEDTGVSEVQLRDRFGDEVTELVKACSDGLDDGAGHALPRDASTWGARKKPYLDALPGKSPRAKLITAADKAHNGSTIVGDVKAHGPDVWERFNATEADLVSYYQEVLAAVRDDLPSNPVVARLESTVAELGRVPRRPRSAAPPEPGGQR